MKPSNGGAAFPLQAYENWDRTEVPGQSGMSLRDYFAAKAMQAIVSMFVNGPPASANTDSNLATAAYMISDAMLKERDKA